MQAGQPPPFDYEETKAEFAREFAAIRAILRGASAASAELHHFVQLAQAGK